MSSLIDPDDYMPSAFRNVAQDLIEAIEDAMDTDGLNSTQRGCLVALHGEAMRVLNFRDAVPDHLPTAWGPCREDAGDKAARHRAMQERANNRRAEVARWRAMSEAERDRVVLDVLGGQEMTTTELWAALAGNPSGVRFSDAKVRGYLKDMAKRGVIEPIAVMRERTGSRVVTAWVATSSVESTR